MALIVQMVLCVSCGRRDVGNLRASHQLIDDWESLPSAVRGRKLPLIERFRKNGKELVFLATTHESNPASETFRMIREELSRKDLELVIVEGVPTQLGLSNSIYLSQILPKPGKPHAWTGENAYAAWNAHRRGIPFLGGEPSRREMQQALVPVGITTRDLIYFFVVSNILPLRRAGLSVNTGSDPYLERALVDSRRGFHVTEPAALSVEDFRKWYQEGHGKPFSLDAMTLQECAPYGRSSLRTNQISFRWEQFRNRHLLDLIARSFKQRRRVLVVFGGGHFLELRRALHKMFDG
ncbi:MAG: hypothetical protein CVU65_13525 [Deltaproteobacteria bacterium HGW-Deltaproteobacteria-22]|nr:MAG: hypothetical protein CVU65_13525 [Deltaproteobacteria bacterium HGW-Deltaproteobacteria-22]